jgi:type VI secretion system protein ImpI
MRLILAIENHDRLPDGGPLSVTVTGGRGIDIGRDQYLDWTLPDPSRFISGKHCEIRLVDGRYFLYDVSTNGTYVNGSQNRVQSPYKLHSGDRLTIGDYIIAVTVDAEVPEVAAPQGIMHRPLSYDDLWKPDGEVAPPISPKELRAERSRRPAPDDWIERPADVPAPLSADRTKSRGEPDPQAAAHGDDQDAGWAPIVSKPQPAPPPPPKPPMPRRILTPDPRGSWSAEAAPSASYILSQEEDGEPSPMAAASRGLEASQGQDQKVSGQSASYQRFLASFATESGVPEQLFQQQSPEELGKRLGSLARLLADEMKQLLDARSETKRLTRSTHQTMIKTHGNNPLKFSPTAEDALRIMLGPATRSYLDAAGAFAQGFADLKSHQLRTYSAMQQAISLIAEDLCPTAIENATGSEGRLARLIGSRKARLWDAYVTRWNAKTQHRDDGLVDVFMHYFADCYDKSGADR